MLSKFFSCLVFQTLFIVTLIPIALIALTPFELLLSRSG